MKLFILATIMSTCPAFADVPLATPPAPISMEQVNAYQPKSTAAISMWPKLSAIAKGEIYQVENRYYFKATDKDSNYEILALAAYDTLVRQEHLDSNIDEHSYVTGFLDCKTALGSKAKDSTETPKKTNHSWKQAGRFVAHGIGYAGLAASTPAGYPRTMIQRVTPANSIAPIYQVSNY